MSSVSEHHGDSVQFFDDVLRAFDRTSRHIAHAPIERFYVVAGEIVCLRFANDALLGAITPALEHLRLPQEAAMRHSHVADLTICLWDSASTGVEMPAPPWKNEDYSVRNEVRGYNDVRIRTVFHMGSGALSVLDIERAQAIFWIRDAQNLPYYESGAPLLAIFAAWSSTRNRQLLHAAAIGNENGGVLLVGRGGSGKSSTALLSLDSPLKYAGDDYCLLSLEPQPVVHSLYSSGKVHGYDIDRFANLRSSLKNSDKLGDEKALYFFSESKRNQIIAGFPVKAIVLPRVCDRTETRLVPARAAQSLLALAPSTIFQLPNAGAREFRVLGALAKQLPSYILELGRDRSQVLAPIVQLLADLTA